MDTGEVIILENGELQLELMHRRKATSMIRRIGLINFKLSMAIWAGVLMFFPPTTTLSAVGSVLHIVWTSLTMAGALTCVVALTMTFWPKLRRASIPIELTGLCVMIVGPFVYWTTQLTLVFESYEGFQQRVALSFFAWAMVAAVVARLATVIPRFHFERLGFGKRGKKGEA